MPRRESPYSHATVHPYLWGLLPDNEGVLERWGREFGCSSSDVVGLLVGVGTDVAGAAQYVEPGADPETYQSGRIDWVDDVEIAPFLRDIQRDATAWRPHAEGRWTLAGAQAKIALLYADATRCWGVPSGSLSTTHILKPAIVDLEDFDINEHLCLEVARTLGMPAAATSIWTFEDQRALVAKRYDRMVQDDGTIQRVHQENLCQVLRVHPNQKYESDGGPSAVDLGRILNEASGGVDVLRLHDVLVYHWLTMSTGGHAKDFSLLLSGPQVRLAPMYDVASGLPYVHPQKSKLAHKIGGENRPLRIRSRHWVRLAHAFKVDPDESMGRITSMIERVSDAFADAVQNPAFTDDERRIVATIAAQITAWAKTASRSLDPAFSQ